MDGAKKNSRRQRDQERAAALKRDGIERTTGRCPICNRVYHADMLKAGYSAHRCENYRDGK